jgi:hypothetical protein
VWLTVGVSGELFVNRLSGCQAFAAFVIHAVGLEAVVG